MKILNLYAGIGGNRKLWGDKHEIIAIENNKEIAAAYQDLFPKDQVIVKDAHKYLIDHFKEFDFIWSSPPCPTHSLTNNFLNAQGIIRYPDLKLWQEIVFLKHWFKGKWVVENVRSYYKPLWNHQESGRHYFWANFNISNLKIKAPFNIANMRASTRKTQEENLKSLEKFHNIDLSNYNLKNKRLVLRNCVKPEIGLHIFKMTFKDKQKTL